MHNSRRDRLPKGFPAKGRTAKRKRKKDMETIPHSNETVKGVLMIKKR
jgi:hypothetical protein